MIGFIMRGLGFGVPGGGIIAAFVGVFVAICAICGISRCMRCRMRDCNCIKRCMRLTGTDKFDDFEMMVVVHEALFTPSKGKMSTMVKVRAGEHKAETDADPHGIYQQPLSIYVEQGTENLTVDLCEGSGHNVLATLKLNVIRDIIEAREPAMERLFNMKQKSKGLLNPRIRLSIAVTNEDDAEQGLLADMSLTHETQTMLRQHLQKVNQNSPKQAPATELDILVRGCCGPLDMFGSWGSKETIYVAVDGPPNNKRYYLGVWKDQAEHDKRIPGQLMIDLLKVLSVQPDPNRTEVFMIQYLDRDRVKKRAQFRRLDRARDVWVEMLTMLVRQVHELKDKKKRTR